MFLEPRRVMEDLARQPRWILPVVLMAVPSVITAMGMRLVPMLWLYLDSVKPSLGEVGRAFLFALAAAGGAFVERIAVLVLSALALVGLMRALGCPLSIRHARAFVSYSLVPLILVGIPLALFEAGAIVLLRSESPLPHWLWLDVAAFFDWSAPHPLAYALARQIGVFALWRWLLVALGLTVVVRSISFWVALGATVIALVSVNSIWDAVWLAVIDPNHLHWP